MKFKQLHTMLLVPLCAALAACSEQDVLVEETIDGKTPIVLSVGGVDTPEPTTRAVITDGTGKTLEPFDVDAKIFMVMRSEYGTVDYKGTTETKYNVARGDVAVSKNDGANNRSIVDFDNLNQRYWDDAHARSSVLSIWGYALRRQSENRCNFNGTSYDTADDTKQPFAWTTTQIEPTLQNWRASNSSDSEAQDASSLLAQDLLFTNNLANNGEGKDERLSFNFTTRKFPLEGDAHMIFYHAMSKITIHIRKGEGFTVSDPFAFTTGNVKLMGFNTQGHFNIVTGQFEEIVQRADIPSIYQWTTPADGDAFTLEALVIPNADGNVVDLADGGSRLSDGSATKAMEFVIDNNRYEISQDQLYDALQALPENAAITADGKVNLEAGKNYVFTFTVGKTKISNITAQLAEWENVTSDMQNPTNARIKLQLEERGEEKTTDVAFYMKKDNKTTDGIDDNYAAYDWKSGYENMSATYSGGHWTTNLFWQSNKDFYHFRALMPDGTAVNPDAAGDYASLSSGASYTDVRWGAPMKDEVINEDPDEFQWTYDPEDKGFDNAAHSQIYKAIGATEDPVKLILFHMMSDLTFNISTTAGTDKVELCHPNGDGTYKRTRLDLVGFYNGGRVLLGTGLVTTDGSVSTEALPVEVPFHSASDATQYVQQQYVFGAVPQDLKDVKLYITTPDDNRYIVDLKDVKASTIATKNIVNPYAQSSGKYVINRWYPGFKYVYSFTLKKTGITNLQATVVDWETITADNETVVIK